MKEKEGEHKEEEEMRKLGKRSSDAKKCGWVVRVHSSQLMILSEFMFKCRVLFACVLSHFKKHSMWEVNRWTRKKKICIFSDNIQKEKKTSLCSTFIFFPYVCKELREGMWKTSSKISKSSWLNKQINDQREQHILESFYTILTMCLSLWIAGTAGIDHSCRPFIAGTCFIC